MGFWTGFFVGLVIGQVALVAVLALFHFSKDNSFNHNHFE